MAEQGLGNESKLVTRTFVCEICQKTLKDKRGLIKHELTHSGIEIHPNILNCNICEKPFKNKYNLQRHFESFHDKSKLKNCNICDKKINRAILNGHMKKHLKLRGNYLCKFCKKIIHKPR